MLKKKRSDGKLVKDMDPMFKVMPIIMEKRYDAQVFYSVEVPLDEITKYINDKRDKGINVGYMHVFYLMFIRILRDKPHLNRFVVKNYMYQREDISISMTVKQSLTEQGNEGTAKCHFTGNETIEEVANILNSAVAEEKKQDNSDIAKFVNVLTKASPRLVRWGTKFLMGLDRRNMLPKKLIELSPFHATAFFTNVGSIGLDAVYHHIYDFGTIGLFVSMGKKYKKIVIENGEIKEVPHLNLGIVIDERIVDGFYFASAMRMLNRYIANPFKLDENKIEDYEEYMSKLEEEEKKDFDKILEEIQGKEKIEEKSKTLFRFFGFPIGSLFKFRKDDKDEKKDRK